MNEVYKLNGELSGQKAKDVQKEWYNNVKVNIDVVNVIKSLRSNEIKVVMLSNTGDCIHDFLEKVEADNIWDKMFLSYEIRLKKPDPKAFQYVLNEMNIDAKDACFIDDREENIKAANNLGIQSILYPSEEFSRLI